MQEVTLAACHHPVARCDVLFNLSLPKASQEESKDMLSTEKILECCSLFMFKTSAASTLVKLAVTSFLSSSSSFKVHLAEVVSWFCHN